LIACAINVTNSVNTVDREAPRYRAKPIVLVVLIQGSKAKEEKERRRELKALIYKKRARAGGPCWGLY
jgi:hypothetical protein